MQNDASTRDLTLMVVAGLAIVGIVVLAAMSHPVASALTTLGALGGMAIGRVSAPKGTEVAPLTGDVNVTTAPSPSPAPAPAAPADPQPGDNAGDSANGSGAGAPELSVPDVPGDA